MGRAYRPALWSLAPQEARIFVDVSSLRHQSPRPSHARASQLACAAAVLASSSERTRIAVHAAPADVTRDSVSRGRRDDLATARSSTLPPSPSTPAYLASQEQRASGARQRYAGSSPELFNGVDGAEEVGL